MFRKIIFASIVAVLILSSSSNPSMAQGTNPNQTDHLRTIFEVAVNPTQRGFASDYAFWNAPVSFNGYLYDAVADFERGLQVIRSAHGKNWEFASMPMPGDTRYNGFWGAFVYNGHLYLSLNQDRCADPSIKTPGLIVRTANGIDWETVFQAPEVGGLANQTGQFGDFNGMLYFATPVGFGQTGITQIWRSRSGNPGTWQLETPAFGNNTDFTSQLTSFKGDAYLSSHDADGMHIWRSADGANWQEVGEDIWNDDSYTNWWGSNLVVFNDSLYIGTNPWFFWLFDPSKYKGGQIYRSRDGVHWELVVKEGFGNPDPSGIDILIVYNDALYAFSNDLAPYDWSAGTTYVYRSRTGNAGDWVKVNDEGLGPSTMVTKSDLAIFKDNLYIGNQFGYGSTIDLMKMVILGDQDKGDNWSVVNTERTVLPVSPGDIVHYCFDVVVGTGLFDVIQVHRVVREGRPNRPIQTADAVFLVPGAPQNFEQIFMPATIASVPKWDQSFAVFLAKNDVDVWGVTYGWALVPPDTTDFSFMKGWGVEKDSQHSDIALSIARLRRGSNGPDFGPLHLLGFSYGAYIAYSVAGAETQRPHFLRNVRGIIPVDASLKYPPGSKLQKACCQWAKDYQAALNAGEYQADTTFFALLGQLARTQPDAPSPIPDFAGLTNYQAALALGMYNGFVGGVSDNGIPKDLLYTNAKLWLDLLATAPPYLPSQIYFDIDAAGCGSDEYRVSFDDNLREIAVPILYVGSGGGEGEAGYFTTEQTASTDVIKFMVSRTDIPNADFAHGDLFLAKDAEKWLWKPILLWIQAHRQ